MISITEIDFYILNFIRNTLSCEALDNFFVFFTRLGDGGIVWILTGLILICTKQYRRCGIVMLCALTVGFITGNLIIKPIVARQRPCWLNDTVNLLISVPRDYSFPSGHTVSSVICCNTLRLYDRRFLVFALPLTLFIAFSRLYLYVHFPTDILCAALYGIAVSTLVFKISEKHFNGFHNTFRKVEK